MSSAAIGFGANLGRPDLTFARALERLGSDRGIRILRVSNLYVSAPWGLERQPEFLNGAALVATEHPPRTLLERLQLLERELGRARGVRWGPRTLDLDLLWYEGFLSSEVSLSVPHPAIGERAFVLAPLAEILPAWRHPSTGRSAAEMLSRLVRSGRATACREVRGIALGDRLPAGRRA
jgi:2-amino-4-hydroxy-6-hydroxymethyldihydropteridine diphosphokinase